MGRQYGIFDNGGLYGIEMRDDGKIQCTFGGQSVDSESSISTQAWTHAACTYDLQSLQIYVNGSLSKCQSAQGLSTQAGAIGVAIGANLTAGPVFTDQFVGGVDNIWLFDRALTGPELCATAGQSGCNTSCPGD